MLMAGQTTACACWKKPKTFYWPLNENSQNQLQQVFTELASDPEHIESARILTVSNRPIHSVKLCKDVGWFTFSALCDGPAPERLH